MKQNILIILAGVLAIASLSAAADKPRSIIALTAHDPMETGRDGSILLSELGRQAVLIAARDGLGLETRDQSLREPFPKSAGAPFDVKTFSNFDNKYKIHLARGQTTTFVEQFPLPATKICAKRNKLAIPNNYYELAERMEALSRGPIVDALRQAGFNSELPPPAPPADAPGTIEPLLEQMSVVTQFDAVRQTHEAIRLRGETPELLGFLVRGYANLGQLTLMDWNAAPKVFQARAILYGQRMVARYPKASLSHAHLAYAWAMTGFYYRGFVELDAANALATPADKASVPGWVELIDPLCSYDISILETLAKTKTRHAPLAMYLAFVVAEPSESQSFVIEQEKKALVLNSRCLRLVDAVSTRAGVRYGHTFTEGSFIVLADDIFSNLGNVARLSPAVVKLIPAQIQQLLDPTVTAAIEKSLVDSGETDSMEPSSAILGRLLQESSFLCVYRRAHFMAVQWGVDRTDFLKEVDPVIAEHPYASFIRSMRLNHAVQREEIRAMTSGIKTIDAEPKMFDFFEWTGRETEPGPFRGATNASAAFYHQDLVARDLIEQFHIGSNKISPIRLLRGIDTNSPFVTIFRIQQDWESISARMPEVEKLFGAYPDVQAALARKYIELGNSEAATDHLNKYIAKSPDLWAFEALANLKLAGKDEAGWLTMMKQALAQEDYGLTHAQIQVKIANHYMDKDDYATAEPYAEQAAQTWARWAMKAAIRCYEHEDKKEKADLWRRREAERYGN